jgi:hypothetical protein
MTIERACANGGGLSRRTLLAALPASTVALALSGDASAAASDPVLPVYREWLEARRLWWELSQLPENGDFDDPRSVAAMERETAAEDLMVTLTPTSIEGIAALAAVAWVYADPGITDTETYDEHARSFECALALAIWRACTGLEGYPITR